ncbi:hypothetical protein [Brazilian marseillevirus]|uniref:hypothetical protein n=1 Tax=Brazilian marseillevirus TaxID=1813599 RepID=UPI000781F2A9|nr:hypothetical protein A3303_gp001 [Brazilian marseillevirus]AMQ10509.1 hypothetical protein [Brazilian marseillevirus]
MDDIVKAVKVVFGGAFLAYTGVIYENFSGGRTEFEKDEFEQWVSSPHPNGLGIIGVNEEKFSSVVSSTCLRMTDRKIVYSEGRYLEVLKGG